MASTDRRPVRAVDGRGLRLAHLPRRRRLRSPGRCLQPRPLPEQEAARAGRTDPHRHQRTDHSRRRARTAATRTHRHLRTDHSRRRARTAATRIHRVLRTGREPSLAAALRTPAMARGGGRRGRLFDRSGLLDNREQAEGVPAAVRNDPTHTRCRRRSPPERCRESCGGRSHGLLADFCRCERSLGAGGAGLEVEPLPFALVLSAPESLTAVWLTTAINRATLRHI